MLKFCWSLTCWITLTALVAGGIAAFYYYFRVDEEIRAYVQKRLSEHYAQLSISIRSARLIKGEGIEIRGVSVVRPQADSGSHRSEMIYIDRLDLRCQPTMNELLKGTLKIQHVSVQGLSIRATQNSQGNWNVEELLPLPRLSQRERLPTISIQNSTVEVLDRRDGKSRLLQFESVDLYVKLKRQAKQSDHFLVAFSGTAQSQHWRQLRMQGLVRTKDNTWSLRGNVDQLRWNSELYRQLPSPATERLQELAALRGLLDFHFQMQSAPSNSPSEPRFWLQGNVQRASYQAPKLQLPLRDLQADFAVDNHRLMVRESSASYGSGKLKASFELQRSGSQQPIQPRHFRVTADRIELTRQLASLLPSALLKTWQRYQPLGIVSGTVDYRASDGLAKAEVDRQTANRTTVNAAANASSEARIEATVDCEDVSFLHYQLPYPIKHCRGRITFRENFLHGVLTGMAGDTPVTLRGEMSHPLDNAQGWFEVRTAELKTLDEAILSALPPATQKLIRQLNFEGAIGIWARFEKPESNPSHASATATPTATPTTNAPFSPHIVIAVRDGRIRYEKFPYPISQISGQIHLQNGHWRFLDFVGQNGRSEIRCDGSYDPTMQRKPLVLRFDADRVQLDTELRNALAPQQQTIWNQLRPTGVLEQLSITWRNDKNRTKPELEIAARQSRTSSAEPAQPKSNDTALAIQPTWLPYRIERISGDAHFADATLTLRDLRGHNGDAYIRTNASGVIESSGSWSLNLTELSVDSLSVNDELLSALPPALGQQFRQMQLRGDLALAGGIHIAKRAGPNQQHPASAWDITINVDHAGAKTSIPIRHAFGEITLRGGSEGRRFWARGTLDLDSVMLSKVQLTQVKGPIHIESNQIQLGRPIQSASPSTNAQPITAQVYGGRLSADAELLLGNEASFTTRLQLTSAEVATLARELHLGQGNLAGQASLELFLTGSPQGRHTLRGGGNARLRNANLYELPLVLALLNRISSGRRDNAAFSSSDVAFRIRDGYVYFDRFDLRGDTITLKGIGEMSIDRELDLDFYTIMGREQLWSPIVRPFLGEASRQFLQIHVDGTLENPVARQEVLPGLNDTLRQLFPEARINENAGTRPQARLRLPSLGSRWRNVLR